MDDSTIEALNGINQRFYDDHAEHFSATRRRAWRGWEQLLPWIGELPTGASSELLRILDVGCGNGRFHRFVAERLQRPFVYAGIDSSASLLAEASRGDSDGCRWIEADVSQPNGLAAIAEQQFDFIGVFGLLHHIPSFACRRRLLERLVERLERDGLLVLSHWQFAGEPRLSDRILPWTRIAEKQMPAAAVADLESGDHLLRWGQPGDDERPAVRYCHHTSDPEAAALIDGLGVVLRRGFRADGHSGRLNLYQVLQRSHRARASARTDGSVSD